MARRLSYIYPVLLVVSLAACNRAGKSDQASIVISSPQHQRSQLNGQTECFAINVTGGDSVGVPTDFTSDSTISEPLTLNQSYNVSLYMYLTNSGCPTWGAISPSDMQLIGTKPVTMNSAQVDITFSLSNSASFAPSPFDLTMGTQTATNGSIGIKGKLSATASMILSNGSIGIKTR